MDPLISSYFKFTKDSHRKARYTPDMLALAQQLDISVKYGKYSVATEQQGIQLACDGTSLSRRSDAAHEIAHALAHKGKYNLAFERYHSSVCDIDAHIEALTDHASDHLLLPDLLVREVLEEVGDCAAAIHLLSVEGEVSLQQAMRRWVFLRTDERRAAFLLSKDYIAFAISTYWVPQWIGDQMQLEAFIENGGTLHPIQGTKLSVAALVI